MARTAETDYLQNFRFWVEAYSGVNGLAPVDENANNVGAAGFQSCSLPELTIEATEYREGTFKYMKKFPGVPTVSDVSLMRGVMTTDTIFFRWAIACISGGEYRSDIDIRQFARTHMTDQTTPAEFSSISEVPARTYKCHECLPLRAKPGADLDATSGEVSMQEVDFALEWFEVIVTGPEASADTDLTTVTAAAGAAT